MNIKVRTVTFGEGFVFEMDIAMGSGIAGKVLSPFVKGDYKGICLIKMY